jgi:NADH dehydrogenase/NADH:ubiquinone oxidoreductase subunit G
MDFALYRGRQGESSSRMGCRLVIVVFFASLFGGCTKPDLPVTVVRASSTEELSDFRAELGTRFTAEQLKPLDIALQELELDAMNRDVTPAAARKQDMQAAVNGRPVREAQILGWKARRSRLLREMAEMTGLLEQNLKMQQKTAATGTPVSVTAHIQNALDIIDRLQRELADTNAVLIAWGAPPSPSAAAKASPPP